MIRNGPPGGDGWTDGSDIHCALGQNTELGIQRIARVLLDTQDRELNCDIEGRVGDVGLLVTQTHGPDEACMLLAFCLGVGDRLQGSTHVRI